MGDFGDLKAMVDWTVLTRMRVIQLLPVYDTTIHKNWLDSYPYNSISIYALHPQYVDLRQLPKLADEKEMAEYEERRAAFECFAPSGLRGGKCLEARVSACRVPS